MKVKHSLDLCLAVSNCRFKPENKKKHKYKIVSRVQDNSPVYTPETNIQGTYERRCELFSYEHLNATTYRNPLLFINFEMWISSLK